MKPSGKTHAIGIDLGTTNSCVAVYKNEIVEVISDNNGFNTTPSFVAFDKNERYIGDSAKDQAQLNPENTIFDIKRLIGRRFADQEVQDDIEFYPFKVIDVKGSPMVEVTFKGETRQFSPEEISSMIIYKMKQIADDFLCEDVKEAVITVPAYFTDAQRKATQNAAQISGIKCLRIINEPTAASIAYGYLQKDEEQKGKQNILVYDFGGGTFDSTVLELDNNIFRVCSTSGDSHLGGEDLDNRLIDYFISEFKTKHGKDISTNNRALSRLRNSVQRLKRTLSAQLKTTLEIESFYDGIDFYMDITRAKFESLVSDLLHKTLEPIDKVMKDSKLKKSQIDKIVLVGGSTKIPKVRQIISDYFNGKELLKTLNPDEAVAEGAAIQAALLSSDKSQCKGIGNITFQDVCPLSLGVKVINDQTSVLIPRNTQIPVCKKDIYTTAIDNQTSCNIEIYEGELKLTKDNYLLGKFLLENIPAAPKGQSKIEVSFDISIDGILTVTAVDQSCISNTNSISIDQNSNRLSDKEVNRMIRESEQLKQEDKLILDTNQCRTDLELLIYNIRNQVNRSVDIRFSAVHKSSILAEIERVNLWLDQNQRATIEDLQEKKIELTTVLSNPPQIIDSVENPNAPAQLTPQQQEIIDYFADKILSHIDDYENLYEQSKVKPSRLLSSQMKEETIKRKETIKALKATKLQLPSYVQARLDKFDAKLKQEYEERTK